MGVLHVLVLALHVAGQLAEGAIAVRAYPRFHARHGALEIVAGAGGLALCEGALAFGFHALGLGSLAPLLLQLQLPPRSDQFRVAVHLGVTVGAVEVFAVLLPPRP